MLRGRPLFDEIVTLTGVSAMFAVGLVTRALADGGVAVDDASAQHYEDALPRLRARLKAYLPDDRAEERAQAIRARITEVKGTPARPAPAGLVRHRVKAQLAERLPEGPAAARLDPQGSAAVSGKEVVEISAPSGVAPADAAQLEWDDAEDFTLVGRRWTADELAALRTRPDGTKK